MMIRTNILKKAFALCLIGTFACFLWVNEGWAACYSECSGRYKDKVAHPHNLPADNCSTNHCATPPQNKANLLSNLYAKNSSSCLSPMPLKQSGGNNISALVGVRTDTKKFCGSYNPTLPDGVRQHQGMDVGTGKVQGVTIYAPAEAIGATFVSGGKHWMTTTSKGETVMKCDRLSSITLTHKRSSGKQKNCQEYKTVFLHVVNIRESLLKAVNKANPLGKNSPIADAGGCSGYSIHMHYEIHDCDGTLYNPTCLEGAGSPQQLCNGTENVIPPAADPGGADGIGSNNATPVNPHLDKKKDCSKMSGTEKTECEARNKEIEKGGTYCKTVKPGEGKADKADSCLVTMVDSGSSCSGSTKQKSIPQNITNALNAAAKQYGLSPTFLASFINLESNFNVNAKNNSTTASGLGQILKGTWNEHCSKLYGSFDENRFKADKNLMCTAKILSDYKKQIAQRKNWKSYAGINVNDNDLLIYAYFQGVGGLDNAVKAGGTNWKNTTAPASSTNASGLKYINTVNCHMKNIAPSNGCSSSGGQICEDFSIPAGDHYGSTGDSAYSYADNHDRFQSGYECNINDNYNSIKGCLFCNLFYTIYNTASKVAKEAHTTLADSFVRLLAVGLAISLAMMIMQYISSMTQKDPMLLLNMIIRKMFVVMIIIVLLKLDVAEFFNMFVTPIFNTGFKLAELAIANSDIKLPTDQSWAFDNKGLPPEMGLSMLRAIYAVQSRLEQLMAVGSNSICIAFYVKSWHGWPIFPHFGYLLTGLFLWLTAIVFMVCYPFLLIDCVLQFTIASALLPAAIAATAFEITKRYLNIFKVINTFFDAMFVFIFLTIVMFILLAGMDGAIIDGIKKAYETDGTGTFNLAELGWFTVSFLKLVFFLFLGKAVLEDIPSFASDFAKGLSMGESGNFLPQGKGSIGRSVGGTAARAATETGKKAAGLAWDNAVKPAARGAVSAYRGVKSGVKGAFHQNRVNRVRQQASLLAAGAPAGTSTANGEAWVSGRTWYGRKIQQRVVKDANGNDILETKRRSLFRNRVVTTQSDGNITMKKKIFKNGKVKETYKMDSILTRSLLKKDGTINKETLAALQQNSGLSQDMLDKAILHKLMKQRLPRAGADWSWRWTRFPPLKRLKADSLESKYTKEIINRYNDENGREVFEIRRIDNDGKTSISRMIKGDKRFRIEQEVISKNGRDYHLVSSDGVVQKNESGRYTYDENGNVIDVKRDKVKFSHAGAYAGAGVRIFDIDGNLNNNYADEGIILDHEDALLYAKQMNRHGDPKKDYTFGR